MAESGEGTAAQPTSGGCVADGRTITDLVRPVTLEYTDPAYLASDDEHFQPRMERLREQTREALAAGLSNPNVLLNDELLPGGAPWMGLRKHAIALHPLYCAPHLETLGGVFPSRILTNRWARDLGRSSCLLTSWAPTAPTASGLATRPSYSSRTRTFVE